MQKTMSTEILLRGSCTEHTSLGDSVLLYIKDRAMSSSNKTLNLAESTDLQMYFLNLIFLPPTPCDSYEELAIENIDKTISFLNQIGSHCPFQTLSLFHIPQLIYSSDNFS